MAFGTILTLIVELSSVFHTLNRTTLFIFWLVTDLVLVIVCLRQRSRRSAATEPAAMFGNDPALNAAGSWPLDGKLLLAGSILIVSVLFLIALLTPTTNGDSLSYHLARMAHWIQQQSVEHFPTDDTRQLEFGPWSSFVMTNLFLLWGNDRLLNLVQWFAMVSSAIALTWIVEQLQVLCKKDSPAANNDERAKKRLIGLTCVLAVTLPIGIVESISTQNDYTTAFWVLCLFSLAFCLWRAPLNPYYMAGAGLAAGLGVLTKATTYLYTAPLLVAGGVWWTLKIRGVRQDSSSERQRSCRGCMLKSAIVFVLPFALLNGGHLIRNYSLFGSPMGSKQILALEKNGKISPAIAASNVIRNLALHTDTGAPWLTRTLNLCLRTAHGLTGQDLNDPASTYENCPFQFFEKLVLFDSVASCSVHLLITLAAFCILIFQPRRNIYLLIYALLAIAGFGLFCILLKWQIWHSRIHLTWFLLLVPIVALVAVERLPRWTFRLSSCALLIAGLVTVFENRSRPVLSKQFWSLPREKQYLIAHDKHLMEPLANLSDQIMRSGAAQVGLKADFCGIEYPLWIMLRNRGFRGRFDRCDVEHISSRIRNGSLPPDVVVSEFSLPPEVAAKAHFHIEKFGSLTVLWKQRSDYVKATGSSDAEK